MGKMSTEHTLQVGIGRYNVGVPAGNLSIKPNIGRDPQVTDSSKVVWDLESYPSRPEVVKPPTQAEVARAQQLAKDRLDWSAQRAAVGDVLGLGDPLPKVGDDETYAHMLVIEEAATRVRIGLETGHISLDAVLQKDRTVPVAGSGDLVVPVIGVGNFVVPATVELLQPVA